MENTTLVNKKELQLLTDDIMERDEKIGKIHNDIKTIKEIYVELADLISIQGDDINKITKNTETTEIKTQMGLENIENASRHQQRCSIQ